VPHLPPVSHCQSPLPPKRQHNEGEGSLISSPHLQPLTSPVEISEAFAVVKKLQFKTLTASWDTACQTVLTKSPGSPSWCTSYWWGRERTKKNTGCKIRRPQVSGWRAQCLSTNPGQPTQSKAFHPNGLNGSICRYSQETAGNLRAHHRDTKPCVQAQRADQDGASTVCSDEALAEVENLAP